MGGSSPSHFYSRNIISMIWKGKFYRPGYGSTLNRRQESSIEELLKPLSEKTQRGNVWIPVKSQIVNVTKETSVGPEPFSPKSIEGLIYWNNYSDSSTLTLNTTTYDSVQSVSDASSGITIYSSLTKSEQPKYDSNGYSTGVGAIYGNTSSSYPALTGTTSQPQDYTIFCSFKPIAPHTSSLTALDSSDSGMSYPGAGFTFRHHQLKTIQSGSNYLVGVAFNTSGSAVLSYPGAGNPLAITNGTWYNVGMRVFSSGGNLELRMYNGSVVPYDVRTIAGTGASGTQKSVLGWNNFEDEMIAEQFMYNRALSAIEIEQIFDYLNARYS